MFQPIYGIGAPKTSLESLVRKLNLRFCEIHWEFRMKSRAAKVPVKNSNNPDLDRPSMEIELAIVGTQTL
jgi:hypothetical protein